MTKQKRPKPRVGQTLYVSLSDPKASWDGFSSVVKYVGTKRFLLETSFGRELEFNISDWHEAGCWSQYVAYTSHQEFTDAWEARRLMKDLREWLCDNSSLLIRLPHLDALRRAHDELVGAPEENTTTQETHD